MNSCNQNQTEIILLKDYFYFWLFKYFWANANWIKVLFWLQDFYLKHFLNTSFSTAAALLLESHLDTSQ